MSICHVASTQEVSILCNQTKGSDAGNFTAASASTSGLRVLICKLGTPANGLKVLLKTKAPSVCTWPLAHDFSWHLLPWFTWEPVTCRNQAGEGSETCHIIATWNNCQEGKYLTLGVQKLGRLKGRLPQERGKWAGIWRVSRISQVQRDGKMEEIACTKVLRWGEWQEPMDAGALGWEGAGAPRKCAILRALWAL